MKPLKIFKNQTKRHIEEIDIVSIYHLMIDLGIDKSHFPCLFLVKFESEENVTSWKLKQNINKEEVIKFLQRIRNETEIKH